METFIAQFINSFSMGSIYALLVIGFNLLVLVTGIFPYAYAHVVVFSMYMCWIGLDISNNNIIVGIIFAIVSAVALSLLTEPLFRPLSRRGAQLGSFIVAMAIGSIITEILARNFNKGMGINFPVELKGEGAIIRFGVTAISIGQIATVVGSIIAGGLFFYILFRTKQGRAFRAIGQSSYNARLLGLPIMRIGILVFVIAGILGGISAIFLSMSLGTASASLADNLAIKIMAVALFSGIGNIGGGIIAALILGLAENMALAYLPGTYSQAIAFAMIMLVVMVKPQGLFGTKA